MSTTDIGWRGVAAVDVEEAEERERGARFTGGSRELLAELLRPYLAQPSHHKSYPSDASSVPYPPWQSP